MPANRFFYASSLSLGEEISLQGEEYKHLAVLRPREEEQVELVNGQGLYATATVRHLSKREATLVIVELKQEPPPSFRLILAQAIPRSPRLDFIVEKGTELGMTDLWLFPGTQSEKTAISENEKMRINHLLISAMKQCGTLFLPSVQFHQGIKQWPRTSYSGYFGDLSPESLPFEKIWKQYPPQHGAIIVIGPEKGLTYDEVEHLRKLSFTGVKLHPNVLRTDTAACAALTLASHLQYSRLTEPISH